MTVVIGLTVTHTRPGKRGDGRLEQNVVMDTYSPDAGFLRHTFHADEYFMEKHVPDEVEGHYARVLEAVMRSMIEATEAYGRGEAWAVPTLTWGERAY